MTLLGSIGIPFLLQAECDVRQPLSHLLANAIHASLEESSETSRAGPIFDQRMGWPGVSLDHGLNYVAESSSKAFLNAIAENIPSSV